MPNDSKSFVLSCRAIGRKRLMTLGAYGILTLDQARKRTGREKAKVLDQHDPLEVRQESREAPAMADLAQAYLDRHALPHKRLDSVKDDRAMLETIMGHPIRQSGPGRRALR